MVKQTPRIITCLDRPVRIVMFTPAEFMLILIPIILGVILGGWLGLFTGVSGIALRKRVKLLF